MQTGKRSLNTLIPGDMGSLPDMLEGTPRAGSPMPNGRPSLNAVGPATCLQAVAPTGISRRDSLPPLNAMPVVQVPQAVQRVLRKRTCVLFGGLLFNLKDTSREKDATRKQNPSGKNAPERNMGKNGGRGSRPDASKKACPDFVDPVPRGAMQASLPPRHPCTDAFPQDSCVQQRHSP